MIDKYNGELTSNTKRTIESTKWYRTSFLYTRSYYPSIRFIEKALVKFCKDEFKVLNIISIDSDVETGKHKFRIVIKFKDKNDAMLVKIKGLEQILQQNS